MSKKSSADVPVGWKATLYVVPSETQYSIFPSPLIPDPIANFVAAANTSAAVPVVNVFVSTVLLDQLAVIPGGGFAIEDCFIQYNPN